MSLHLLLAPAASGKTEYCISRIQTVRRENPLAAIWAILPNGANVAAFRRRLGNAGGAMGVRLGTLYTLYVELLAAAGKLAARLDEPVIYRVLRAIAGELHAAGALDFFSSIHTTPGFARALHGAIQELKRARITPEQFAATIQGRGARLAELARLYAAYQDRLLSAEWADDEGQGWVTVRALEQDAHLAHGWRLLAVDGFDEFNPTQLAVLRLLAARTDETLITLTGDAAPTAKSKHARLAYRRFARARAAIESSLSPYHPVTWSPSLPTTPLKRIESALFESSAPKIPSDGAIELIEAPNRAEEIRAALRWLKARVVRERWTPGEIALLARDLAPYRALIEETAAEFGLPIYLGEGDNLANNPAVAALLNLLALIAQDFPRRRVVDAWRSPYLDWSAQGLEAGDAEQLDAAARWGQVAVGLAQWEDTLTRLTVALPDADESVERDDTAPLSAPMGATAAALLRKFRRFATRLTPPSGKATSRDYVAWLEELIGDDPELSTEYTRESDAGLRVVHCARAEAATRDRDVAALREFKNVLRALVFAESALDAARPLTFVEFWTDLSGAVEATRYRVPPPEETETILAASVLSARGLSFRAIALVGLAEGEFPRAATEDPLLPEADRATLHLLPRFSGEEVTFFYEAVMRATEKLLLTRPYLAADGQPWEPSPYWEHILHLVDASPARSADTRAPKDAASLSELIEMGTEFNAIPNARREAVKQGAAVLAARMADEARGRFEGDLTALQSRLANDFAPSHPWSASRLETFGACPFAFFAAYALALEPRLPTQAGYAARQLGTMLHAVLETLFRRAADPTDLDTLLAALPNIAREVFAAAPERYGFRPTAVWQRQQAELERVLTDTVRALHDASAGWRPIRFELVFGKENIPALVLHGAQGEIRLRGYIDRVDVNDAGELRVVDYKTGSSPISKNDLDEGRRLQLALYALAARDALRIGKPVAGAYWHIRAAKPSSLKLEKYPGGIDAAFEKASAHALAYASRVRAGDFAPHVPTDGCPSWCPAAAFCWRYKPGQ